MPDKTDGSDQLQPESGEPKVDLSPDEIVSKISATYGEGKRVVTLVGYLGQSPEGDEYVRFYPDISLRIYCDIPGDKVILRERVPLIDVPNASKIVVAGDLKLKLVKEAEMEASFLGGAIAAAYSLLERKSASSRRRPAPRGASIQGRVHPASLAAVIVREETTQRAVRPANSASESGLASNPPPVRHAIPRELLAIMPGREPSAYAPIGSCREFPAGTGAD